MITKELAASDWKKLSLKKASHAHITKDTIFIVFKDRLQGVEVDYAVNVPNEFIDIRLGQTLNDPVRTYMVSGGFVRYLKDVHTLLHYPRNSCEDSGLAKMDLNLDTVIAMTKKGDISFSTVKNKITGRELTCADIHATK